MTFSIRNVSSPHLKWPIAVLTLLLLCVTPAYAQLSEPSPMISVVGTGTAEVAPDMAMLQLTVTREAETARAALDANSAAMTKVLASLRDEGIAERDLQTSNFSIQPKYVYPSKQSQGADRTPKIVGYTVRNGLTVRVRDLEKLGGIIDKSVTLGVNQGGNITFSNDNPSSTIAEARKRAVADARDKAQTLAEAAGVSLGKIMQISEHSGRVSPMPIEQADMMASRAAAESVPVAAGESAYQVTVNMSYAISQ
ncbi:MAG: SIMPL domain-containing protein [Pseudomonadota bacterium]